MKVAAVAFAALLQITAVSAETNPGRKRTHLNHVSQQKPRAIQHEEKSNNHRRNLQVASSEATSLSMSAPIAVTSTIYEIGGADADFSTLVSLVDAAGLTDVFKGEGTLTLFAPTNEAFDALLATLPEGYIDQLLLPENIGDLQDILKYHALGVTALSSDLASGDVETLNGDLVTVTVGDAGVMVNDASVIVPDVMASNGVIHVIDKVLLPPEENAAANMTTAVPEITPSVDTISTTMATSTIYELGLADGNFSTLVSLVDAADLADIFEGEGTLTLFAPTNEAFDALLATLPEGYIDQLLLPENIGDLQDILKYHALGVTALSSDLVSGDVETLNGDLVTVTVGDAGATVNDASVIVPDVMASNGVIHVIDKVLLPPEDNAGDMVAPETTVAPDTTVAPETTGTSKSTDGIETVGESSMSVSASVSLSVSMSLSALLAFLHLQFHE